MGRIVRTPTRAEGGITDAERLRMDACTRKWINIAMRTDKIEPDKIADAIHRLYEVSGLNRPRVVVVPSPLVMAASYGAAAAIWFDRKKGRAATRVATDAATRAIAAATDAATDAATRAATYAATHAATEDATSAIDGQNGAMAACRDLAGDFGINCAKLWWRAYQGGNMWAYIGSYLEAARDVLGLNLPEFSKYAPWEDAAMQGGFRVMHEEFCIVSDFPEYIKTDGDNLPHCETGPSHKWRDGSEIYHWHGQRVPGEWIKNPDDVLMSEVLQTSDVDQRSAGVDIFGWARILTSLDATTIDDSGDPSIGSLIEVILPDHGKQKFIKGLCGTGREIAVMASNDAKTIIEAQAMAVGMTAEDFQIPEIRT